MTTRVVFLAVAVLLLMAAPVLAVTGVHGIVQDDAYRPVSGGHVWIEHEHQNNWYIEFVNNEMQGHSFGWGLTKPGNYRIRYEKPGYEVVWIRSGEFTLATAPFGDIQVNVRRVAVAPTATTVPVPTTLMPPTVDPTVTPSGYVRPYGVISWFGTWSLGTQIGRATTGEFLQLSEMWQWNVIAKARSEQHKPLATLLEVMDDPLWLSGADMELGAQETNRFEVGPYEGMGFAQAIVVRER